MKSLISPDGENVALLLGAPRSGTTWLAKILDSHPDLIYRHEPDTVLRNEKLPYLCPREDVGRYRDEARNYLQHLLELRSLKSAGSRPLFPKNYHRHLARQLRAVLVYGLLAVDALSGGAQWPRRVAIPDLLVKSPGRRPTILFKSVSSRGRALLFAEALPLSRVIFVIRHPCGQVASMMRHIGNDNAGFGAVLSTAEARQVGLTPEYFTGLTPLERCAWHWTILNQKALNDLSGLRDGRVAVLRYEDTCAEPEQVARKLFAFLALSWNQQTAWFVRTSTTAEDTNELYRTSRNSLLAANKWRSTLSRPDQRRILDIASRLPVGAMFEIDDRDAA